MPPGKEFVFVTSEGKQVGKAKNIIEFIRALKQVPIASIAYHSNGGHFAPWLEFIGEKEVAARVAKIKGSTEETRLSLIRAI